MSDNTEALQALTACKGLCHRIIEQYDGWPQCGVDFQALLKGVDRGIAALAQQAATPTDTVERCARVCEAQAERFMQGSPLEGNKPYAAIECAKAIRATLGQAATPAPAEPVGYVTPGTLDWMKRHDKPEGVCAAIFGEPCRSATLPLYAAPLATPAAQPADERNQCDGCQASMPMRGDIHTDEAGHAVMSCQRGRYALKGNA